MSQLSNRIQMNEAAFQVTGMPPQPSSLWDSYNATFEVVKADTPELLQMVFQLRYQIYGVENNFLHHGDNLGEFEIDIYDANAEHYLLLHRASGLPVGSVRMVLPKLTDLSSSLPIQAVCPDIPAFSDPNHMRYASEISRFCISKEMRRRVTDGDWGAARGPVPVGAPEIDRRVLNCVMLGLIRACIESGQQHGIHYAYLICEPTLLRLLNKVGVGSTTLGPLVEYHGLRQPVLIDDDTKLLENTYQTHPDVWSILSDNGRLKPRVRPQA